MVGSYFEPSRKTDFKIYINTCYNTCLGNRKLAPQYSLKPFLLHLILTIPSYPFFYVSN